MSKIRIAAMAIAFAFLSGQSADVCNSLTATGVGAFAPKYPKSGSQGICDAQGVYTMMAFGHDYYWAWDRGGFSYIVVRGTADFSFSARLVEGDISDVISEKVGLCVREGLVGNERAVQLRWDGFFGGSAANAQISWLYRMIPGTVTSEFCSNENRSSCFQEGGTGVTTANNSVLKVSRISGKYQLFVNDTRVAEDKNIALMGDSVLVGLIASFGGGDNPVTRQVIFDNIQCEGCGTSSVSFLPARSNNRPHWNVRLQGKNLSVVAPDRESAKISAIALYDATGKLLSRVSAAGTDGASFEIGRITHARTGVVVAAILLNDGRVQTTRVSIVK